MEVSDGLAGAKLPVVRAVGRRSVEGTLPPAQDVRHLPTS